MPHITVKIATETLWGGMAASTQSFNSGPVLFWIILKKGGSMNEMMIINIVPINNCARCSDELQVCFQLFLSVSAIGRATSIVK